MKITVEFCSGMNPTDIRKELEVTKPVSTMEDLKEYVFNRFYSGRVNFTNWINIISCDDEEFPFYQISIPLKANPLLIRRRSL